MTHSWEKKMGDAILHILGERLNRRELNKLFQEKKLQRSMLILNMQRYI